MDRKPSPKSPECPVCCQEYTDVKRVHISCAYCEYDACQECYRTYILSAMQDAHCMQCRQVWSRDVLSGYFPPAWLNGPYRKHREHILLEREKQLLPESQYLVANFKLVQQIRGDALQKRTDLRMLKKRVRTMEHELRRDKHRADILERNGYTGRFAAEGSQSKKAKVQYVAPCPIEECRGFLDSTMVCGVCHGASCLKCGVPLLPDHEHTCKDEEVASFQAIKKQTRACPKCAVPTFKVSGCSQMWCVACHATWDWNTGDIVTGVIHNPHYFAYLRQRSANGEIPRQPVECNRRHFPGGYAVNSTFSRLMGTMDQKSEEYIVKRNLCDQMIELMRKLIHIVEVTLPGFRQRYMEADNADLRLLYLANEITEDTLKIKLQRREKKREKDLAVRDIYQMICDTSRDTMWQYVDGDKTLEDTCEELSALRNYSNDHLKKVRDHYKMSVEMI